MDAVQWIVDLVLRRLGLSTPAMPPAYDVEGGPLVLPNVVEKSKSYDLDDGENEDLCTANRTRSRGNAEVHEQRFSRAVGQIEHDVGRKLVIIKTPLRIENHPNIDSVYGFLVQCHANGNALQYLAKVPKADKHQMVTDVANALRSMHAFEPPLIHGNLKASNVFIKDDGHASISDIGIYTVLSQPDFTTANIAGSMRWTAQELLRLSGEDEDKLLSAVLTRETDVYAFGMTVLEIYTGKKPFSNVKHDPWVVVAVDKGKRPSRPESPEITDELWALMCDCWKEDPRERSSMARVYERLIESS